MNYFLVQKDNQLIHLPDCRFEEGKRIPVEVPYLNGTAFVQGRRQPDMFVFSVPSGAVIEPCLIVDENAIVRRVLVSKTEVGAHAYIAAGLVEESFEAPEIGAARNAIAKALKALNEE